MDALSDLSTPAKGTLLGVPLGVAGADAFFIANGANWKWVLLFSLLALLIAAALLYIGYRFMMKRRGKAFEGAIDDAARRSSGAAKPEERAAMEDLRRRFLEGFELYKREGFNPYDVPWYLVMGEPGSGKTFAVRNSGIGFLPGMQNERQGTGGTKTMDWWFTKSGVLLDTAGRWSVGAGGEQSLASQELAQFLRLLKKNRPRCPVNGLILVLDGEKMQNETKEESLEKAKLLSEALFQVKRELDVRFPVIIWISKCDTIPGFRSYFDSFSDAKQQSQMLGWSNPSQNIDDPFKPEQVEEFLSGVVAELRNRRWQLLYDQKLAGDARRIDAVDSLFVFPSHLEKVAPAVRTYMEMIFGDTRRAPFLRGIYFNSAITEGAEVDRTIAEAMGLTPQQYREQSRQNELFKRDRALFIRDTLAEKLFKERNLVSRASNAVAALRRTQILFVSALALCLVAMATMAWFSSSRLRKDLGGAARGWKVAATDMKPDSYFIKEAADIVYRGDAIDLKYVEQEKVVEKMQAFLALSETLADCAKDTRIPPPFGWIMSRSGSSQEDRRKAWSRLFEKNYLAPLSQAILSVTDNATNRQGRVVGLVKFDALLLTNPPPVLADNDPFPKAFLGAFLNAEPQALDDNARLLARASQAKLISTTWYAPIREKVWDRAADAFDALIADKKNDLKVSVDFVDSARRQASADQAFVKALDEFEILTEKVDPARLSAADLQNLRAAFNAWVAARPGVRTHANLAGAGEEATRKLDGSFGQSFKSLQDDLASVKVGSLAPDFLKKITDFRSTEVKSLNDRWSQLTKDFSLAEISAASRKGEELLPAVAASLVLFGPEYAPTAELPFAGWTKFEKERDDLRRRSSTVSNELGRVLLLASAYQRGRAFADAGDLARRTEADLARWPLANSNNRIPEDQFGPAVARAKAMLADPNGLGHPDSRSSTTNLARLIGIADQLVTRKKMAIQFRLAAKQADPAFRSLILEGEGNTEYVNFNPTSPQTVTRIVPLDSFRFKARYADRDEGQGSLAGRWGFLERFWDAGTGALRTNHVVPLPIGNGSVDIEVIGANWVE
jgi:type VI protein secretion system component VasK